MAIPGELSSGWVSPPFFLVLVEGEEASGWSFGTGRTGPLGAGLPPGESSGSCIWDESSFFVVWMRTMLEVEIHPRGNPDDRNLTMVQALRGVMGI